MNLSKIQLLISAMTLIGMLGMSLALCDISFSLNVGSSPTPVQERAQQVSMPFVKTVKADVAECATDEMLQDPDSLIWQLYREGKINTQEYWKNCGFTFGDSEAVHNSEPGKPVVVKTPTPHTTPTPTCKENPDAPWCYGPSNTPTPTPTPIVDQTPQITQEPTPTQTPTTTATPTTTSQNLDTLSTGADGCYKEYYPSGQIRRDDCSTLTEDSSKGYIPEPNKYAKCEWLVEQVQGGKSWFNDELAECIANASETE